MSKQVAVTILQQLGGNKFIVMTGANSFVAMDNGMAFRIPGKGFAKNGINAIRITLNAADLYDVEYLRIWGSKITEVSKSENIYFDMLQEDFTRNTGLDTSL